MHRDMDALKENLEQAKVENRLLEYMGEELKHGMELAQLWEIHSYFHELPEEAFQNNAYLASHMTHVCVLEGDLETAKRYMEYTKSNPKIYEFTRVFYPALTNNEFRQAIEDLYHRKSGVPQDMVLTAVRPTLINGFRDFTLYGEIMPKLKHRYEEVMPALYGDVAGIVYKIACAELLYQRNECFEALVIVVSAIQEMKESTDIRCLLVAKALEMYILVLNGQVQSAELITNKLRRRIEQQKNHGLEKNLDALEVFAAMYDGHTELINHWMLNGAPDEFNDFNMLDTYRYTIKMRCYLLQKKHMALLSLGETLIPLLESTYRTMDVCEIRMLIAMCYHDQKKNDLAFDMMDGVLRTAELYRYDRLIGDEGDRMYRLLYDYRKVRGNSPYLKRVMDIAKQVGMAHPNYLKMQYSNAENLSEVEQNVLRLMAEEHSNAEIGMMLDIALNTVKFHAKNIYKKLSVNSRGQAVKKAKELGIL